MFQILDYSKSKRHGLQSELKCSSNDRSHGLYFTTVFRPCESVGRCDALYQKRSLALIKGVGTWTCRIGPVNRQKDQSRWTKVAWVFFFFFLCVCSEHFFYSHEQHLFSCINPLLLCYRVLNLGRVANFGHFYIFDHFDNGRSQITNQSKFWQWWDLIVPYKILWD